LRQADKGELEKMNTKYTIRMKRWIMLLLPLLIMGFVLAACSGDDDNDNEGGGGGLDTTPDITGTEVSPVETPVTEMTDTPEIVDDTPTMAPTIEPTAAVTVTVEPTAVMTDTVTPEATEDLTAAGQSSGVILASDLIGTDVEDQTGEEIGTVTEAIANREGQIMYVFVDIDALNLDAGDNVTGTVEAGETDMIVLTWEDFVIEVDLDEDELIGEAHDFNLILSGDMAMTDIDRVTEDFLSLLDEDDYIIDDDFDADLDILPEYAGMIQVSAYDNFELENIGQDDLGDTEDLLIDIENGQILYAILDVGGFLGIGENEVAVPWSALALDEATLADDDEIFRIDVDDTFLEEAPTIDLDDWSAQVEQGWDQAYRDYWVDFIEEF
jgi:sporulation protein YlmC with PRC-barrel domain